MSGPLIVIGASLSYIGLLFLIAWYADRRAEAGRSIIANPTVYALSLAVYCTAWTFFGSVGLAAVSGMAFLPVYLGPTLMAALWPTVLRKILRIAKVHRITSIADFIAARYGKSQGLAALVSIIAVVGVVPYLALQLKAVSASFSLVTGTPTTTHGAVFADSALYIALVMAAFTIVFGTRKIDATERHEGLVAAVAFESLVKLAAFIAVGLFTCFVLFESPRALFAQAAASPQLAHLMAFDASTGNYSNWFTVLILSALAIVLLPRQFQVAVVENVDEEHVRRAVWLFPLYLLAINVFVLPVALAGVAHFGAGTVAPDTYVLALPLAMDWPGLALLVYIGGLSAATSMIIIETTALATMICNDLVMPLMLRWQKARGGAGELRRTLLYVRRAAILLVLLLGYSYFRIAAEARTLVSIGLISFAAVAQFGPALFGGLYWKDATRAGALAGLAGGFAVWAYTLLTPSFVAGGLLPANLLVEGPFGLAWLRPDAMFGLDSLDPLAHGVFWSLLLNIGAYVGVSLSTRADASESAQAAIFVDALSHREREGTLRLWRGGAPVEELRALLRRIEGADRADRVLEEYRSAHGGREPQADAELMQHVESVLAGSVGSASARVMVAAIAREEPLSREEVLRLLDETSQAIHYSRRLEEQSRELTARTEELRDANEKLRLLDRMKDDFISVVTHELRTPLTSIRSFAEILHGNPDLSIDARQRYLGIVTKEAERLTRLINQVLDLAKLEAGSGDWHNERFSLRAVVDDALASTAGLFEEARVSVACDAPDEDIRVLADRDRLMQVLLNVLFNAIKFSPRGGGRVVVRLRRADGEARIDVADNGVGVSADEREVIFEKFRQGKNQADGQRYGTGLGLPISRLILQRFGGRIWVENTPGGGATFCFTLPAEAEK